MNGQKNIKLWLLFITVVESVYSAVRTDSLYERQSRIVIIMMRSHSKVKTYFKVSK